MLERLNPVLRLVCLALAGLVVYQISQLAFKRDALAKGKLAAAPIHSAPAKKETNSAPGSAQSSSNAPAADTNAAVAATAPSLPPGIVLPPGVTLPPGALTGMAVRGGPSGRPGRGGGPSDLPADVQAMVEKIKTSQILGPDIKPPPMALLGIAGKDVFLRGPNGQTGIIREGEELGGVKLIRIGTNRVLVEENKQQKELTIFEGFGSPTLMSPTEGKK